METKRSGKIIKDKRAIGFRTYLYDDKKLIRRVFAKTEKEAKEVLNKYLNPIY